MRKILALPRGGKRAGRDKKGEGEMEVEQILVIVEIPKGGRNKYEYDEGLGRFRLDRMLFSSVHYPSDYGYVEGTLAEDGDALDAMVVVGEATFPGCAIWAKPVGLFKMWDEKGLDHKVLCVPVGDPQWNWVEDVADVPEHLLLEIEHFFSIYKDLEMKKTRVAGWEEAARAWEVIEEVSAEPYIEIPEEVQEVYKLWRPSPLIRAKRLEKALDTPAKIYYKYEGVSPAGSHKPNTSVPQAYYNKKDGTKRLTTETGAGQWGSALSLATQLFGLECLVYMVRVSFDQKPYRKSMIKAWGADIIPSPSDTTEAGRAIPVSYTHLRA